MFALMRNLPKLVTVMAFGIILGAGEPSLAYAAPAANNSEPALSLFAPAKSTAGADVAFVRDRQAVRSRQVDVNVNLLSVAADLPPEASTVGRVISLSLFDGVSFVAEAFRIERTARGVNWVGRLRGIDLSQVVITTNGDIVAGNITMPGARYHIRFVGNGIHEIQQIDTSLFPDMDEPSVPVPPGQDSGAPSHGPDLPSSTQADTGSLIDVMVAYTATTRATAGGTAALQALIDLAVTETNQSYQNSGVTQRLRLVHAVEVAYTETGDLYADLDCITLTADGCLDNLHTLRNTYGADLVSFWVENGGPGFCGLAWLMTSVTTSFAPNGFSTVARSCATGYYSFGHELGHNMGARHDTYVDTATTPYSYAHGYTYTATATPWRTVMGYNTACSAVGLNCTRIQYWSNPSVMFGGAAMGNASADNQQALDNTAFTVANFRAAVSSCTPGLDSDSDGIPDCVEETELRNPLVKDNDIFTIDRLFAMQQYRDFLSREGEPGGVVAWTNYITSGTYSRAQVVDSFFNSPEFGGVVPPVVRLYFAYFLRIPDYVGLLHWVGQYRAGLPLASISEAFSASQEFLIRYGSLDNGQFVTLLYANVLGRVPDTAGYNFWVTQLNSGAMTRGQVMLGFSESAEYQIKSYNSVYVTMMYVGMLRRSPEQAGFDAWVARLNAGMSGLNLINGFIVSPEYYRRFL